MKKVLALIAATAMCLATLTACGGNDAASSASANGSAATSAEDANGAYTLAKDGVLTMAIYAKDDYGQDHVVEYNKGNDAVMALVQGKVDAVIIDNEPAKSYVDANEGLKILDTKYVTEDYAACIAKENTGLTKAVNEALAELEKDGTLKGILDKYITAE